LSTTENINIEVQGGPKTKPLLNYKKIVLNRIKVYQLD